jgi:hypothetical protein
MAFIMMPSVSYAKLLIGGVQQSDYLSAVTPQMSDQIGKALGQPEVEWFMVPKWMAGQWTKDGDVTLSVTNLRTGIETPVNQWTANRITRQFGQQIGPLGNLWRAVLVPQEYDSENQNSVTHKFVIIALKLEENTGSDIVTRTRYLVTETMGFTTTKQYQQESLNHYSLTPEGQLQNKSENRIYDLSGKALQDAKLLSKWTKTAEFTPVAECQGIDLAKSLNYYLTAHGQAQIAKGYDTQEAQHSDSGNGSDDSSVGF